MIKKIVFSFIVISTVSLYPNFAAITEKQALEIGKKIWKNECGATITGLTSWNDGEEFASLGIGHFIWCPQGKTCPFSETFPALLSFLQRHGKKLPSWLKPGMACPWKNRTQFLKDFDGPRMTALRTLLATSIDIQAKFIVQRLDGALPGILKTLPPAKHTHIKRQFTRLEQTPSGLFALIDYINFKGEGSLSKEQYNGRGWGLINVLESMKGSEPQTAVKEFVACAKHVLTQRVTNSPKKRNEERWLPGWKNRLDTYLN